MHVDDITIQERITKRSQEEDRADDSELTKRLEEYAEKTLPAIEFFKTKVPVLEIKGTGELDAISAAVYDGLAAL